MSLIFNVNHTMIISKVLTTVLVTYYFLTIKSDGYPKGRLSFLSISWNFSEIEKMFWVRATSFDKSWIHCWTTVFVHVSVILKHVSQGCCRNTRKLPRTQKLPTRDSNDCDKTNVLTVHPNSKQQIRLKQYHLFLIWLWSLTAVP